MTKNDTYTDGTERLPRYSRPRVEKYTRGTREGGSEEQERVAVVRDKTVLTGTLTGDGTEEVTHKQTLANFPASHAYNVMQALADEFNCEVQER
ncbi:hypothetical protein ACLI4U_19165 (plasmid) [Natrialbaceae archaeon A-CW2]